MGFLILWPCSLALPGPCYPKHPALRTKQSLPNELLTPAKQGIHRHSRSPPGHILRPVQACTISTLQACASKACQARDPHPPPGLHRLAWYPLHWAIPLRAAQACMITTLRGHDPKNCQAASHRLSWSPLGHTLRPAQASKISTGLCPQACTGMIAAPTGHVLKAWKPDISQTRKISTSLAHAPKASTCRPVGPHPPATSDRRAPNLPKRHTQTGLDAKGVTSQQLRLQFYCYRTGDLFFSSFFPFFKGFTAWFAA
jgi:hypothetical protein